MTASYPLYWPRGRRRTPAVDRRRARFNEKRNNVRYTQTAELTIASALERLDFEIERLGVSNPILSTNVERRLDGRPRSDNRLIEDPGAALWFTLQGQDTVLACDRWDRVADNIAAIAKHIEALRGIERWGVGSIREAFAGYAALPYDSSRPADTSPQVQSWWQVLDVDRAAPWSEIEARWRDLMRTAHPDQGGDPELAKRLNAARDAARKERTYNV